jgi:hypothetical protein
MFIAALLTIAEFWNKPRCPSMDEWIKNMRYIYTMEFYSTMKKNEIMLFAESRWNWRSSCYVRWASPIKTIITCFLSFLEVKGKWNKTKSQGHESKIRTTIDLKVEGERGRRGIRKIK